MAVNDAHEWLSLIDISGPFLAPPVLDVAFPQGLDGLDGSKKTTIRQDYEEWVEAIDEDDDQSLLIHGEWIHRVLKEILEWDEDGSGENLKATGPIIESLHYESPDHGIAVKSDWVLVDDRSSDKPFIAVQVLPPASDLDAAPDDTAWAASASERFIELLRHNELRLGLITNGESWRLIDAPVGGVTTSATWQARLWSQEPTTLQAFIALFRIERFFGDAARQLPAMLDASLQHQDEVTDALGDQITRAVEVLIQALDKADADRNRELLEGIEPEVLYEASLTLMMRLVFLLCAEERELMDVVTLERFDSAYAVSSLRMQLREQADQHSENILEKRFDAWSRLLAIFRAVYGGVEHGALRMPALGGSLFDPDKYPFLEGRASGTTWREQPADPLPIDNRTVLLLMDAIQLYRGRTLSYRALDVENIGYVYEGLLEKTVQRAKTVTIEFAATQSAKKTWASLEEIEAATADGSLEDLLKDRTGSSGNKVQNELSKPVDPLDQDRLLQACGNKPDLRDRILSVANLIRKDAWGGPLVFPRGTYMMTAGQDRRDTGSHYTPKLLTEAIVKETLEPLVYEGPSVGKTRGEWQLKSSAALLNLKICEPAMGSGSFLVQVCRWLGDRVVEAWHHEESSGAVIDVDGQHHAAGAAVEPLPKATEERIIIARRLVAERCIYGIDINPLAVELAKLSVWLVTLAKERPFGFLDHNLRWGDCLLGIHSLDQLAELHPNPSQGESVHGGLFDYRSKVKAAVDSALEKRRKIRTHRVRDIGDIEEMARLNESAQEELKVCHRIADAMMGEVLANPDRIDSSMVILGVEAGEALSGNQTSLNSMITKARQTLSVNQAESKPPRSPFHWPLEYPEVFEAGGFDAIVGNPPYLGGQRITGALGPQYRDYLVNHIAGRMRGSADLVAYFFLHCHSLLREGGLYGLLGVNTIAEGDTRAVGLEQLLGARDATIVAAYPNEAWPGSAAVVTSRVHLMRGSWDGGITLNGQSVNYVSAFLSDQEEWTPKKLTANEGKSFQGSIILGLGFTLSEEEAQGMIGRDPKNAEVLFPYLNGKDLNSHPEQQASRWVINFFDWPEERAHQYAEPYAKVLKDVKPGRLELNTKTSVGKRRARFWWQYASDAKTLYHAIGRGDSFQSYSEELTGRSQNDRVIVQARVSKYFAPYFSRSEYILSEQLVVFVRESNAELALLNSAFHEEWAWKQGSRMKRDLRYTPSDIYETFPFPKGLDDADLEALGDSYHQTRADALIARNVGLTKFYNLFHDPDCYDDDVTDLRAIRVKIDRAVADAYGWNDLTLDHDFHEVDYLPENDRIRYTVSREVRIEILKRLSALNKERYEEEVAAGLHKKKQPKAKSAPKKKSPAKMPRPQTAANDGVPPQQVAEPAAQYDMLGEAEEPAPRHGNSWGANAIDQILAWLEAHPGPQSQQAILNGSGANLAEWSEAVAELIRDGDVIEEQGRYRAVS